MLKESKHTTNTRTAIHYSFGIENLRITALKAAARIQPLFFKFKTVLSVYFYRASLRVLLSAEYSISLGPNLYCNYYLI